MRCQQVQRHLPLYTRHELPDTVHGAIARHLDACTACRSFLEREQEMDRTLAQYVNIAEPVIVGQAPVRSNYTLSRPRLHLLPAVGTLFLILFLMAGGVAAAVQYVVYEYPQRYAAFNEVQSKVSFTLFTTQVAKVEYIQFLDVPVQPGVFVTYLLPDGRRFSVMQQPVFLPEYHMDESSIINKDVDIGDGGILYLAVYTFANPEEAPAKLPSLVWRDQGTELIFHVNPSYPMSAEEIVSIAQTFTPLPQSR